MNKRTASRHRRAASGPSAIESPARQPIRWHRVGLLVSAVVAVAALVLAGLGWWPTGVQDPPAESLGVADVSAPRAARLETLPATAVFPPVEQLRSEADELSRNLRERFPDSANAFHIAARQAADFRQYQDAERWWRRAIELAPKLPAPQVGLASVQLEQGNASEAITILQRALEDGLESAETYALLVQGLQATGELEQALEVCNTGLRRFPDDVSLLQERGQIQIQQQHWELARKDLERVIQLNPQALAARSSLATVLARIGEDSLAAQQREQYEELKSADPTDEHDFDEIYRAAMQQIVVETLLDSAQEYKRQGDSGTAEQLLVRTLALQPSNAVAYKSLVVMFREQSRWEDAYTVQERLVKIEPTPAQQINLAGFAMALERLGEAEAALSAALESDPNSVLAHRTLALLYLQNDFLKDAQSHAEQACRIGESSQDYQLLARICLRLKDEAGYQAALRKAEAAASR